jgi:ectoine hydroxylase-related dioxygenase (phytanoyl-CoA dioxygenase family)
MMNETTTTSASSATSSRQHAFDRDGYSRVRSVLSPEQVTATRARLVEIFAKRSPFPGDDNGDVTRMRAYNDAFNRYPGIAWIAFQPHVVSALREILGDEIVYLPEVALHDSGFGGWHKDTTSQEVAGHRFQWSPDFRMAQCAVYLQDNTSAHGGGLDVQPGSHRRWDRTALLRRVTDRKVGHVLARPLVNVKAWVDERRKETVWTNAGDMVAFHFRLDHSATKPRVVPVPAAHRKLAIFFVASTKNRHARKYVDFIKSRPDYRYFEGFSYTDEVRGLAERAGVELYEP